MLRRLRSLVSRNPNKVSSVHDPSSHISFPPGSIVDQPPRLIVESEETDEQVAKVRLRRLFASNGTSFVHLAASRRITQDEDFATFMYSSILHKRGSLGLTTNRIQAAALRYKIGLDQAMAHRTEIVVQALLTSVTMFAIMVFFRNHMSLNTGFFAAGVTYSAYLASLLESSKEMTRHHVSSTERMSKKVPVEGLTHVAVVNEEVISAGDSIILRMRYGESMLQYTRRLYSTLCFRTKLDVARIWALQRADILGTLMMFSLPQVVPMSGVLWKDMLLAFTSMSPTLTKVIVALRVLTSRQDVLSLCLRDLLAPRSGGVQWAVSVGAFSTAQTLSYTMPPYTWKGDVIYFVVSTEGMKAHEVDISETPRVVVKLYRNCSGASKPTQCMITCLPNNKGLLEMSWREAEDVIRRDSAVCRFKEIEVFDLGCGIGKWIMPVNSEGADFVIPEQGDLDYIRLPVDPDMVADDCLRLMASSVHTLIVPDAARGVTARLHGAIPTTVMANLLGHRIALALDKSLVESDAVLRRLMRSALGRDTSGIPKPLSTSHQPMVVSVRSHGRRRLRLRRRRRAAPAGYGSGRHTETEMSRVPAAIATQLVMRSGWFETLTNTTAHGGPLVSNPSSELRAVLLCTHDILSQHPIFVELDSDNSIDSVYLTPGQGRVPVRIEKVILSHQGPDMMLASGRIVCAESQLRDYKLAEVARKVAAFPECRVLDLSHNKLTGSRLTPGEHGHNPLRAILQLDHIDFVDVTHNPIAVEFLAAVRNEELQKLIWIPVHMLGTKDWHGYVSSIARRKIVRQAHYRFYKSSLLAPELVRSPVTDATKKT